MNKPLTSQDLRPSRRHFLAGTVAAAAGLTLGFSITPEAGATGTPPEVNAWIVVAPDDRVIIRIARAEMGQGTLTGLAQLAAEELGCDWSKVTTEFPTPGENLARNRVWGSFSTGGSRGIRDSQDYVRKGGAQARMMLIAAAAKRWGVATSECTAANSRVTHTPSGRSLSFGAVAEDAGKIAPPTQVTLKEPKDWTLIGQPVKRLDTLDKLTGKQVYGIDVQLPGMLIAAIKDCPVVGGSVKSVKAEAVAQMRGVKRVVRVGDSAVAVVADTYWNAKTALEALPIDWDMGPNAHVSSDTINAHLVEGLADDASDVFIGTRKGDVAAAITGAAKTISATYGFPFQNHATLEPMNATAIVTADRCEVWCPTQNGEGALQAAAEAAGLRLAQCDVHRMILGGGFGRRGFSDYVTQVVTIAKQMPGTPIKLIWSREEDMAHGRYHPITQAKLTAGVDAQGRIVGMHMRISGQSIRASFTPGAPPAADPGMYQGINAEGAEGRFSYQIPNLLIDQAIRNSHLIPGYWRGVNLNQNAVYVESFMDEVAHATGQDPLALRRKMLSGKSLAVLDAVAAKANYGKAPAGRFHGIAQIMGFGSYVAACAEVSVAPNGKLTIHKIVAATDCGHAVNPAQIERQIAGSFAYGLSAMLYGGLTVKDGAVVESNFDSYNILRIDEMPQVECIVMPSGGFWGGVGEPTIAVAAPAVLNAIYNATGKRVRMLPLMNTSLKSADTAAPKAVTPG
jgi:isoquinoline 1-oxidoreductase beta subunit